MADESMEQFIQEQKQPVTHSVTQPDAGAAQAEVQPTGAEPEQQQQQQESAPAKKEEAQRQQEGDAGEHPDAIRKRIDKLTWEKYEARREAERAKAELEELKAKVPSAAPAATEARPQEKDFEDYGQYLQSLSAWTVKQELRAIEAQRTQKETAQKAETDRKALMDRLQDGFQKHPADYANAFKNPADGGPAVSEAMLEGLAHSEMPSEVLYWLSKNQAESLRLAEIRDPWRLSREIAHIEHRIKSTPPPEKRAVSSAPPPITPVSTTGSVSVPDFERMSQEEFNYYHRQRRSASG